jgi:Rubrerythrin
MSLKPFQEKILQQLINQEVLLSRLYSIFSKQFPQCKEFWEKLSKEEERHAKLIEKLFEATKTGSIFFDEGKIKTYTLTAFITRLESIIEKAERGEIKYHSAFTYAVDYESSLIEKNVFSHFDSLSNKLKGTLKILQTETINHVERIKNERKAVISE